MPNAESGVFAILFWGCGGRREREEWEERGEGDEGEERGVRG